MAPIYWPICALTPLSAVASPKFSNIVGNPTMRGNSQVAGSDAGRWKVSATDFALTTPKQIKLWRAIEARAMGMQNQIVFPVFEADRVPILGSVAPIPHSDGSFFSRGEGYVWWIYRAKILEDVPLFATTLTMEFEGGIPPESGHSFSVNDRYYRIADVLSQTSTTATIRFISTCRETMKAGDGMNFDRPTCLCRLATDDEMSLDGLEKSSRIVTSIMLIEDTGPKTS